MGETNEEQRLNLIKEADICLAIKDLATKKPWPDPSVDEITKDVTWLIEQAERASGLDKLGELKASYIKTINQQNYENGVLKEENQQLREGIKKLMGKAAEYDSDLRDMDASTVFSELYDLLEVDKDE